MRDMAKVMLGESIELCPFLLHRGNQSQTGKSISPLDTIPGTCFYTMSVCYLAAKVTKTRYTLPSVLLSLTASAVMSLLLARGMG